MSRIVYLTPGCFDKGGISRYNRYQITCIRELYGEGNVRVISLVGPDHNDIEEPFSVYWCGGASFTLNKIRFVLVMLKCLFFWRPDLIVNAHVNFSGIVYVFSKVFGIKNILNVYGSEVWSGLRFDIRMGLMRSDFVISDCYNTADYVRSHYRQHDDITVIWDCVDIDKFKYDDTRFAFIRDKYNLPDRDNNVLILTLGRMAERTDYKGYSRLIEVFNKVLSTGSQVRLIMAGSGALVETLKARAVSLGIESRITFTGSVDEEDMAALYSYGHIFSLVTESGVGMGEGIPLTPLEAMACQCPIIVGNQDGSREAVFEPRNGYIIDPMDLDVHAEIICMLANDPLLLKELSANARLIAEKHFAYELFKAKHKIFMDNILNR